MDVEIIGEAGTRNCSMRLRKDALVCAIDVINACRDLVVEEGKGALQLEPSNQSQIRGPQSQIKFFGIDLRHPNADSLQNLQNLINKKIKRKAQNIVVRKESKSFGKEPLPSPIRVESVQSASDQLKQLSCDAIRAFHDACLLASQVPQYLCQVKRSQP